MAVADAPPGISQSSVIFSVALLVAYTAIVAWVAYDMATAWPHEGSISAVVLWLFCPGIVFQSVNLVYAWRTRLRLARRAQTRAITIPVGLVLAAALAETASIIAMENFERAYAPFVAEIGANLAAPCLPGARYFESPLVADYNRDLDNRRPKARLQYDQQRDKQRFVLAFNGGSMDIDGSTFYYDSNAKAWKKFHNDNAAESAVYAKLTAGLAECFLQKP